MVVGIFSQFQFFHKFGLNRHKSPGCTLDKQPRPLFLSIAYKNCLQALFIKLAQGNFGSQMRTHNGCQGIMGEFIGIIFQMFKVYQVIRYLKS